MPANNRQLLLASRPKGEPTLDNFKLVESDVPTPGPGQMLVRTIYLFPRPLYAGPDERGEILRQARGS